MRRTAHVHGLKVINQLAARFGELSFALSRFPDVTVRVQHKDCIGNSDLALVDEVESLFLFGGIPVLVAGVFGRKGGHRQDDVPFQAEFLVPLSEQRLEASRAAERDDHRGAFSRSFVGRSV